MAQRSLVFDADALLLSKHILPFVLRDFQVIITELVSTEARIPIQLSIAELEEEDRELAYQILRRGFGKEAAISYKKRGRMKHAGEAESLALAKRLQVPIVLHEYLPTLWCKTYNISYIRLVDLPEKMNTIPIDKLYAFYESLCKQKSSQKACDKAKELMQKKGK